MYQLGPWTAGGGLVGQSKPSGKKLQWPFGSLRQVEIQALSHFAKPSPQGRGYPSEGLRGAGGRGAVQRG